VLHRVSVRWWLLFVVACSEPSPVRVEVATFPAIESRQLDLLLMIDDSTGADFEARMSIAMGPFVKALAAPLLPDLHIGMATSDLGTSGSLAPDQPAPAIGTVGQGGCAGQGDAGIMQTSGAGVAGTFIVDDGQTRNYTDPLDKTLGRMITVGVTGCGFEQPLSAIRRALRVNEGFLRSDASLAVVILADEDDCSVRDAGLFTSDQLGPLTSFRCTREGVRCNEPLDVAGVKSGCTTRDDSVFVEDPQITADFLHLLERGPERVTVSAIVGPRAPLAVVPRAINGTQMLGLDASCASTAMTGTQIAHPAVRTSDFIERFGSRGQLASICESSYTPAMEAIATTIKRSLGIACIDASLVSCEVRDVLDRTERTLPLCPAAGDCYTFVTDPQACTGTQVRVVVERKTTPHPNTRVDVACEL
jgi:hypothetical protein